MKKIQNTILILEGILVSLITLSIFYTFTLNDTINITISPITFEDMSYGMILLLFTFFTNLFLLFHSKTKNNLEAKTTTYLQITNHLLFVLFISTLFIETTTNQIHKLYLSYFGSRELLINQTLYQLFYDNIVSNIISGILLSITYYIYYRLRIPFKKDETL